MRIYFIQSSNKGRILLKCFLYNIAKFVIHLQESGYIFNRILSVFEEISN